MTPSGVAGTWSGSAEEEPPGVERVQPVDVLVRVDRGDDARLVDVRRQRELHEDPVDRVVRVQLLEQLEDLALRRRLGQPVVARLDARLLRGLVLPADVDVRRGIVADEDRRKADVGAERRDVPGDLSADLLRDQFPVDSHSRHRCEAYFRGADLPIPGGPQLR